jgi:hypothetical protein
VGWLGSETAALLNVVPAIWNVAESRRTEAAPENIPQQPMIRHRRRLT